MYTDAHRLVVQVFLSTGVMDSCDLKKLVKTACERCKVENSGRDVDEFLNLVNNHLKKNAMEIKKKREEETGHETYALVQTSESGPGKLATDYHPKELELFKEIIGKVVQAENGQASSMDCLNLVDVLDRRITKDEAQNAMKKFITERWLYEDEDGQISIAARGIMELQIFLKEKYSDFIIMCYLCQDIVIKGQLCTNCNNVKLHYFCAQRLFGSLPNPKCPDCEAEWLYDIPQLNGAPADEPAATPDQSQPSTSGRRRATRH